MSNLTWKCVTQSGSTYYLHQNGHVDYANGKRSYPAWNIIDRTHAETLSDIIRQPQQNTPEIGKAIYCQGFDRWRITTPIKTINLIGDK